MWVLNFTSIFYYHDQHYINLIGMFYSDHICSELFKACVQEILR